MQAETTTVASGATNGTQANGRSYDAAMTPDGRYVTFASQASNLVPNDGNGIPDVFVRDMVAGTTTLASVGATQNSSSSATMSTPRITPDGRYVAFYSSAVGMEAGASGNGDVYVRDLSAGITIRAGAVALGIMQSAFGGSISGVSSYCPRISDDGQYIAFKCSATNAPGVTAVLVYDQTDGSTTLVTTNAIGSLPDDENQYGPEITPDGRFIAYASQTPSGSTNVYVWDSLADTNILASSDGSGVPTNAISDTPVISPDGRYVAFRSDATTLVTNAVLPGFHLYLRDLQLGTTELVDADTNGAGSTDVGFSFPSMSDDGQVVVFDALDGDLVSDDVNNAFDVFARDTMSGTNELISQRDSTLVPQTGDALTRISPYSISSNGRWMVFESFANDLVPNDTNGACDVFLRDLWTGQTTLVSAGLNGGSALGGNSDSAVISANGRYVAFASAATNLTADAVTNINIFWRDLQTGTTMLISANAYLPGAPMTNYSDPVISADGRYIAYLSYRATFNTYWRDVNSNAPVLLSTGTGTSAFLPSMNADGRYVVYQTNSSFLQLRIHDTQFGTDIFTNPWPYSSPTVSSAAISPDGSRLLYQTSGNTEENTVGVTQIATGANLLSFYSTTPVQSAGQWSSDGRYVVFVGITNTTDTVGKVYLRDLATSNIILVSYDAPNGGPANGPSDMPTISGDGRFVAYRSYATDIVAGDTNLVPQLYLYDRLAGTNSILSVAQNGSNPFPWISGPVISAGAENVAFLSVGSDLVSGDLNRVSDAFAVRVLMRLQISPLALPGATTTLAWQTVPDRTYQVEYKDNLADATWQTLPATISFTGNEGSVTVPADQPNRFYRVVETQ
jgi:Tol biopolymer transport system component